MEQNRGNFGFYTGAEFLNLQIKPREWMVQGLIREKDSVNLRGEEKSGKSLLALQLCCSLTSGEAFLNKFKVTRPYRVSYILFEGELSDVQDRAKRMIGELSFEPDNFQLVYSPPLELQIDGVMENLRAKLLDFKPELVIFDPVYFAFMGDLSDNAVVRRFLGNIKVFKETLGCAIMLVCHPPKDRYSQDGNRLKGGTFGSKFWDAWADHVLVLENDQKSGVRSLSCDVQRSGDITQQCALKLLQPIPLRFEVTEAITGKEQEIIRLFTEGGHTELTTSQIADKIGVQRPNVYPFINKIINRLNKREDGKRVLYSLCV